jgi:hypothetical protein
MEENSPCKKITFLQPEGSRKMGRPKLTWLYSVLKDIKLLKIEAWRKKALDRDIWGRIIKEATVHTGLYSQRKRKKFERQVAEEQDKPDLVNQMAGKKSLGTPF